MFKADQKFLIALICLPTLLFSCKKETKEIEERKSEVITVIDHYASDSIIFIYPNGRRVGVLRDDSTKKPMNENGKISTWPDELYNGQWPNISEEVADPYFQEEEFDVLLGPSYVPFHMSYYAQKVKYDNYIVNFINVFVLLKNPTAFYVNSSGRNTQRTSEIMGLSWYVTPSLPSPQVVFTWDFYVNCYYTYTPWYTPITRQYHYQKSQLIFG
jgi:hypothetical protein